MKNICTQHTLDTAQVLMLFLSSNLSFYAVALSKSALTPLNVTAVTVAEIVTQ